MLPVVAFVDEDALFGGIGDSQIGDVSPDSLSATGTLGIFWGSDNSDTLDGTTQDGAGAADTTGNNAALTGRALYFSSASVTATGTATMNAGGAVLTSKGDLVSTQLVENGTKLVGYVDSGPAGFDAGDRLVFDVTLSDDATGSFEFTLHDQLDHAANGNENDITLQFDYTARDFDGDTDTGSFVVGVDDDMPIVDIGVGTPQPVSHLALQLDESVQPDGAANPSYDRYNSPSEAGESGGGAQNGAADDVDPAPADQNYNQAPVIETAPVAAEAIGSRTTDAGKIGQLFTGWSGGQVGADDPAQTTVKTLGFVLTQGNADALFVATNLTATQTGAPELANHDSGDRAIYLHRISETVLEGRIAGADGSAGTGDDFVAFRITLNNANDPATATITVDQFMAIDHGADNPSVFDENLILELAEGASLGLKLDLATTDFDGDPVSDSATVAIANDDGSFVSFDDDGPVVTSVIQDSGLGNELIVNGSFENLPANTIGSPDWEIFHGIPGWTSSGGIPFEIQTGGAGGLAAQSGNALIELDSDTEGNPANNNVGDINATGNTNATIQQLVPGTVAGQTYELTFWYAPRAGDGTNSAGLKVSFGGVEVLDILANANPYSSGSWHQITLTVTATGPSSVLAFTGTGTENEHGAFLDNVSLKASYGNTIDDEDITPPGIGIDGGAGDDGAGTVVSGKINFDAGTDELKEIVFNEGASGLSAIWVNGNNVGFPEVVTLDWVQNGQGGTLYGNSTHFNTQANPAFKLVVDTDGTYIFTLYAPLEHSVEDDPATAEVETSFEDNLLVNLGFKIVDNDGDEAPGTLTINVDDDSPEFVDGGIEDATVAALNVGVTEDLNLVFGADGQHVADGLEITGWADLPGITETLSDDGKTLTATIDGSGNPPTPLYTLVLSPVTGVYTFTQHNTLPGGGSILPTVATTDSYGPTPSHDYAGFTLYGLNGGELNSSAQGVGVDNNGIADPESLKIVFDGPMTTATLGINHLGNGSMEIDWVAYAADGVTIVQSGTTTTFSGDSTVTITPSGPFKSIELTGDEVTGPSPQFRIDSIGGDAAGTIPLESLTFEVTGMDGDGDAVSDTFGVTLYVNTPPTLSLEAPGETVNEFGLADGSTQGSGHTATGSFTLADSDGLGDLESVTINGTTITIANLLTAPPIVGAHGTLDITATMRRPGWSSYTYKLTSQTTDVAGGDETDVFTLSVSDGTTSSANQT